MITTVFFVLFVVSVVLLFIAIVVNQIFSKDKSYKDLINGISFGLLSVAWWYFIVRIISSIEFDQPLVYARIGTLLAISISVYVAIWIHYGNIKWRESEAYLKKCEDLLEKAYEIFTDKMDHQNRPQNDRRVWLNTARTLTAGQLLSKKITDAGHKEIYVELEQYWRGRFYDLLKPSDDKLFPECYFSESYTEFANGTKPSGRSIIAIYRFIDWPNYALDPLDTQKEFTDNELEMWSRNGPRGAASILSKVRSNIRW